MPRSIVRAMRLPKGVIVAAIAAGGSRCTTRGRHARAVSRRTVLGHPGHQSLGAGQRRHRHRRPRESVQRLRLSQAAGPARRQYDARAQPIPARLRPASRRRRTLRLDHAGADRGDSRRPRHLRRRRTRSTSATSTPSPTPPTRNASSKSPGAAPPARTTMAGKWRWRRRPAAIGRSI